MRRSEGPLQPGRIILAIIFLGVVFYVLKGNELNFSLLAGVAMAAIFILIVIVVQLLFGRRDR